MAERKLDVSVNAKLLHGYTGRLHKYELTWKGTNDGDKTIHGIIMEVKFHPSLPIENEGDFKKDEEEKIDKKIYIQYHSKKETKLQPGRTFTLSIIFQVNTQIYHNGILDDKFYWTIFADDMQPIKGEEVLHKHTNF